MSRREYAFVPLFSAWNVGTMTAMLTWAHVGDLHADESDGFVSIDQLDAIVSELNALGDAVDFAFLPGDNANHGTAAQYAQIVAALARLCAPWRMIPGDHDVEPGDLNAYRTAVPAGNRPAIEVIAGHRCIFLDIVSAGQGGPDFRLAMGERRRVAEELARAEAQGTPALVFMHAYPGDLAADGDEVARLFADAQVAFVDTGHTHCNELLNDGRVLYGATRSTGQIEEGPPGYSLVTLRDGVASWHFRTLGAPWPLVRILAPSDLRLVTRPADPRQVPRPGTVDVVAQVLGGAGAPVVLTVDRGVPVTMQAGEGLWHATVPLASGLHRLSIACGDAADAIDVLVRPADMLPKRGPPVALGRDVHAIGAWPEREILGTRLGPNRNGGAS